MQKYFEVGQIVNTFGINGTVKVKPFTDEIERFEELKNVLIDKNNKLIKCELENVKYQKQMIFFFFAGDLKEVYNVALNLVLEIVSENIEYRFGFVYFSINLH